MFPYHASCNTSVSRTDNIVNFFKVNAGGVVIRLTSPITSHAILPPIPYYQPCPIADQPKVITQGHVGIKLHCGCNTTDFYIALMHCFVIYHLTKF